MQRTGKTHLYLGHFSALAYWFKESFKLGQIEHTLIHKDQSKNGQAVGTGRYYQLINSFI
jgi:hypothetical protein